MFQTDTIFLLALASIYFAIIYLTASPSVAGGDSGELLAEGCSLGTAHPPGYPLFTLMIYVIKSFYTSTHSALSTSNVSSLFNYLAVFLAGNYSAAYIANITSAAFTIIAGYLICQSVLLMQSLLFPYSTILLRKRSVGCYGASIYCFGMFTFSPLIWQYATTSEVFPMNTMFAALLVYLVLLFAKEYSINIAYLGAFVCGLALCNQHTILLYEIPLILWVLYLLFHRHYFHQHQTTSVKMTNSIIWMQLLLLSLCFVLGLLPYIYLPLASLYYPSPGSWGDVKTWKGFLHHVLRKDYGTFQLYSGNDKVGNSSTAVNSSFSRVLLGIDHGWLLEVWTNSITRTMLYLIDFATVQSNYITVVLVIIVVIEVIRIPIMSNMMTSTDIPSSINSSTTLMTSAATALAANNDNNNNNNINKDIKVNGKGKSKNVVKPTNTSNVINKQNKINASEKTNKAVTQNNILENHFNGTNTVATAVATTTTVDIISLQMQAAFTPLILLLTQCFYLFIFHGLSNLPIQGDKNQLFYGIHQRFWMQPNVLMFLWSGYGVFRVVNVFYDVMEFILNKFTDDRKLAVNDDNGDGNNQIYARNTKHNGSHNNIKSYLRSMIEVLTIAISIFFVYTQYGTHLSLSDQSRTHYFRQYAFALLSPLPPHAILLINADQKWSSVRYLQQCENIRKDVTVINLSMMTYSSWFHTKQMIYSNITGNNNNINSNNNSNDSGNNSAKKKQKSKRKQQQNSPSSQSIIFPGQYLAPPNTLPVYKKQAYTLLQFLDANMDNNNNNIHYEYKIFFAGNAVTQINYPDNELHKKYESLNSGLAVQFIPYNKLPNGTAYQALVDKKWRQITNIFSSQLSLSSSSNRHNNNTDSSSSFHYYLPSEDKYDESTWEWTIRRDIYDRLIDTAALSLERGIDIAHKDPAPLVYALYLLETALYLESHFTSCRSPVPASLLKNTGLAHVHLIQNKLLPYQINSTWLLYHQDDDYITSTSSLTSNSTSTTNKDENGGMTMNGNSNNRSSSISAINKKNYDIFQTTKAIGWPTSANVDKWKEWSTSRFIACWGTFLSRPDAITDPQYSTIKSLYDTATGAVNTKQNFTNLDKARDRYKQQQEIKRKKMKASKKKKKFIWGKI